MQGDKRVYAEIIILRAVETTDCKLTLGIDGDFVLRYIISVMTARAFPFDNEFLSKCATRIINEVHGGKFES